MTDTETPHADTVPPSLLQSLIPIVFLVILLALSVNLFGDNSSYGANQIALLLAAGVAALVGEYNGFSWKLIEEGIVRGISMSLGALLILFAVGSLIGSWILSGIVPTMIYYGLDLMSPNWFYLASCVICAIIAISIGSSWTVAGTIGVSLMGVAVGMGLSPAITAGAIISGAYFGDKMSPLSDTTNLAPAVTGTDLFSHIKHMTWTTIPSLLIAMLIFMFLGFGVDATADSSSVLELQQTIKTIFDPNLLMLLPMVIVFVMAAMKFPAFPTIMVGALLGVLFAAYFQPEQVKRLAGLEGSLGILKGTWIALFDGYKSDTGVVALDELLSRGGMSSMLNTVWLIITAMTFGAVLETVGILKRIVDSLLTLVKSTGSLIATTVATCIGMNIIAADQYIAIVLPGRMYRAEFARRNLAPKNLSRTLEDSATLTSALIPWNTCGAFMAATLGVATWTYAPFAFFNWINPIVAIIYGFMGFKLVPIDPNKSTTHIEPGDEPSYNDLA
jgi:NhaC family Na+:H+ antiporter